MFHGKVVEPCEIFAFGIGLDDDSGQLQTVQMPAQVLDDGLLVHFGCKPAGKHDLSGVKEDDCRSDKLVYDRHRVLYVASWFTIGIAYSMSLKAAVWLLLLKLKG